MESESNSSAFIRVHSYVYVYLELFPLPCHVPDYLGMKVGRMTLTLALENVYLQKRNKCSDSLPGTYLADKSDIKEILTQSTVVFAQENIYDVPSRSDITYFGAGPSALQHEVIKDAAQALANYKTGLGPAEHSHRSDIAATILNEAKADLASYLDISDDYEILFMQGGGSAEFSALDYNSVGAWVARKHREIGGGFDALNFGCEERSEAGLYYYWWLVTEGSGGS